MAIFSRYAHLDTVLNTSSSPISTVITAIAQNRLCCCVTKDSTGIDASTVGLRFLKRVVEMHRAAAKCESPSLPDSTPRTCQIATMALPPPRGGGAAPPPGSGGLPSTMSSSSSGPFSRLPTPGFAGYNLAWSPFYPDRMAVAGSANYGLVGNGRLHLVGVNSAGPQAGLPQLNVQKTCVGRDEVGMALHSAPQINIQTSQFPLFGFAISSSPPFSDTTHKTASTTWHGRNYTKIN